MPTAREIIHTVVNATLFDMLQLLILKANIILMLPKQLHHFALQSARAPLLYCAGLCLKPISCSWRRARFMSKNRINSNEQQVCQDRSAFRSFINSSRQAMVVHQGRTLQVSELVSVRSFAHAAHYELFLDFRVSSDFPPCAFQTVQPCPGCSWSAWHSLLWALLSTFSNWPCSRLCEMTSIFSSRVQSLFRLWSEVLP